MTGEVNCCAASCGCQGQSINRAETTKQKEGEHALEPFPLSDTESFIMKPVSLVISRVRALSGVLTN